MTRLRAIEILHALWCYESVSYPEKEIREALQMAIDLMEYFDKLAELRDRITEVHDGNTIL